MTDDDNIEKLLAAGLVRREGNNVVMTPDGQKLLKQGVRGKQYGPQLLVDTVRARLKPSIKKKKHRK